MEYKIFGCKVNKFFVNKRLNYFDNYQNNQDNSIMIASCVVTDRAKTKWAKEAKKNLKEGKNVYVTGCGSFNKGGVMDYDSFFKLYPQLEEYKENIFLLGEDPSNQDDFINAGEYELNKDYFQDNKIYTKKFIVIQSGCDTHCSFCLTIKKRGGNRNRAKEDIIKEIKDFEAQGGKEIVLTGVNMSAWGCTNTRNPQENQFSYLLESIINETSIPRIRLSSLGPEFLDDKFFEIVENDRFMPHFHFSIQHFSDSVLKGMNRNYDYKILEKVLTKIRNLNRSDKDYISIGADIIVGFPGETQEDFQFLLDNIKKFKVTKLHAFPFSAHLKGEIVPATNFSNHVPKELKKEREKILLEEGEKIRDKFVKENENTQWEIMVEGERDGKRLGWTPNYIQTFVDSHLYNQGDIVKVKLN